MSKNVTRKARRAKATKEKKLAEKELAAKMELFGELGDECLTCQRSFDKADKEQVKTWSVVVRKEEGKVNLYCPDCWAKALALVQEYLARLPKEEVKDDAVV